MKREEALKTVQNAFDVLGNPIRFQIFRKVLEEGCDCDLDGMSGFAGNCVSAIMKDLDLPQSTVSSYLKDLQNWGLITCQKNGKYLYCKPDRETLVTMKSFIDSAVEQVG